VLRGVDFSETSRIVTFLSPERGRLVCLAQGARRPKSALASALGTFTRLEIVYYWKDSRNVQKLGEATVLEPFNGLRTQVEKAVYAAFPLELAYKTAQENEPSHELYVTLVTGLRSLEAWDSDIRWHTAWLALRMLEAAGYAPKTVADGPATGFSYDSGVTTRGEQNDRRIGKPEEEALRCLSERWEECPPFHAASKAVFSLLRGFAMRQLDTDFRSLRVIDQMFGST